MGRVDPPNPVHTRPYGPARRSAILRYDGDAATLEAQAGAIRQRVQAAVPALDVLLVTGRWSVIYPPTNQETTP